MKKNHDHKINIPAFQVLEPVIKQLVNDEDCWKTLDVDYYPPRVERLYTTYGESRIFLHVAHKPEESVPCLYHKHRWAAAFKILKGSYEMGITYSPDEINSASAYGYPDIAKFIMVAGSYYEMTQTDALHYVRPISKVSYSIMITSDLYPEAEFRKEVVDKKLVELSVERKREILRDFRELLNK